MDHGIHPIHPRANFCQVKSVAVAVRYRTRMRSARDLASRRGARLQNERMDIRARILFVAKNTRSARCAPPLDHLTIEKCDAGGSKIVEEEISRTGPGSLTFRADEMDSKIGKHSKKDH